MRLFAYEKQVQALEAGALEQLVLFLIIMLTVNIVAIIIENLDGLLTQKMQLEITRNFGKPVFEYIQNVPLYHMSDSNFVADKERAINAVENDILLVVQNINGSIALIVSIIVLSVMVAQYDVLALVVLIIMVIVQNVFTKRGTSEGVELNKSLEMFKIKEAYFNKLFVDKNSSKEIRQWRLTDYIEGKRYWLNEEIKRKTLDLEKKWTGINLFWACVMYFFEFIYYIVLYIRYTRGSVMLGTLIYLIQVLSTYLVSFTQVIQHIKIIASVKSNHRRYELERKITKEKRVEKYFVELLSDRYAAKDIRTYDLVNFFFSKMIDVKEKITLEYKRLCQKNTFQRTIATVTQSMAMAMALLLTGYLVIKKKTPIGAFVLVYNTGRNLQSAVSSFVGTISTWDQFGINFADWNRLMNLEEEPEGDEDCIDKIHEIEMKNVEFRYPQRSESAVKNINLRILTGEKIAIVGENGSGKTTLLYLLLGIYRPISGEASVNGKTMELNLDNYRKKTACLIQNFVHFQMTLRENLAPNDFSELSEDPLIDFANNFPDRLNTFLGALDSNGVELSGGQWKRIALYRTLHKKDVDLIVLDEPTANLDPKISENIINRLLKPNYNKTVIVITHDFELAKKFDRIIGMKEGKIICDSPPQAFAWELFEKHNSDKRSLPQIG